MNILQRQTGIIRRLDALAEPLFLVALVWVAHFWYFRSFGLYEDDFSHIGPPLGWTFSEFLGSFEVLVRWPLGRPLGFFVMFVLSYVGGKIGGLGAIYIIAYLVQATNAVVFYWLFRRLGQPVVARVGALVFALFPADTTHTFLTHALSLHTSLTCLLIAGHLYLSNRIVLAHVVSTLCLLIYESPYMVFLAMPLLLRPWDRKLGRELLRHAVIWVGILLAVVAMRVVLGEGRLSELNSPALGIAELFRRVVTALWMGPMVALSTFWSGPEYAITHWSRGLSWMLLGVLPATAWMLWRGSRQTAHRMAPSATATSSRLRGSPAQTLRLATAGLVMWSLAYGLSFTHFPPIETTGRFTSVHLAAAFGGATLLGGLVAIGLKAGARVGIQRFGTTLTALYVGVTVGYRLLIQQDFTAVWEAQREFWSDATEQTPDATEETVIFVLNERLVDGQFIRVNSWADPYVLEQLYAYPSEWRSPPRLYVVDTGWPDASVFRDGHFQWYFAAAAGKPRWITLPEGNLIQLERRRGEFVRQEGTVMIDGRPFLLKPIPEEAQPAWKPGPLYPLLISPGL